jgi:type IV secretion system protein VirD4
MLKLLAALALADAVLLGAAFAALHVYGRGLEPEILSALRPLTLFLTLIPAFVITRFMPFERWVLKLAGWSLFAGGLAFTAWPISVAAAVKGLPAFHLLTQAAAGLFVAVMGLRLIIRSGRILVGIQRGEDYERSKHGTFGTGRFATDDEMKIFHRPEGLVFGILEDKLLRFLGEGLAIVIAPMRSGKGITAVIIWLLEYLGGCLVIDPKGENYAITAISRRLLGHRVYRLAPMRIPKCPGPQHRFNPFDQVVTPSEHDREGQSRFQNDCQLLADGIVQFAEGDKAHFNDLAKTIIAGAIADVAWRSPRHERNLGSVYRLLTSGEANVEAWSKAMMANPQIGAGLPALCGQALTAAQGDERGSFFTTLTRQVQWLADPLVQDSLSASDFDLNDVIQGRADLYVCVGAEYAQRFSRLFRVVINSAIQVALRQERRPKRNFKLVLDEFAVLGQMTSLLDPKTGAGVVTYGAGYGIDTVVILQDRRQLDLNYGKDGATVWMGACNLLSIFGVSAAQGREADELAALAGETTVVVQSDSQGVGTQDRGQPMGGNASGNLGISRSEQKRNVITGDELRRLKADEALVLTKAAPYPMKVKRVAYFDRREWDYRYAVNPYIVDVPQPKAVTVDEAA